MINLTKQIFAAALKLSTSACVASVLANPLPTTSMPQKPNGTSLAPVIVSDIGTTNFGTFIGIPMFLYMLGVPAGTFSAFHGLKCNLWSCTNGEKQGVAAYQIFSRTGINPSALMHEYFTKAGGGRCFIYCNRYDISNVHHKGFVRTFISNFGPAAPDPRVDQYAIALLAAFLNIRPHNLRESRTFLSLLMNNIQDPNKFCQRNQRCVAVINGFRAYQQALQSGNVTNQTLNLTSQDVESITQGGQG